MRRKKKSRSGVNGEDGSRSPHPPVPPAVASPSDLNLPSEFSQTSPVKVLQADEKWHSYTPGSISSEISSRRVRGFQGLGTTAPTGSELEAIKRKYLKELDQLFFPGSQAFNQLGPKVYKHVYKMIQNAKSAEECHIFLLQCAVKAGVYGPTQVSCALDGDYPAGFDPNDCKTSAVHNIIADAHADVTTGDRIVRLTLNSIENCPGTCRRIKEGEAAAIASLSTILADFYHDIGGSVSLLGMMGTSTGWELIARLLDPSKFKVYIPCNYHLSLLAYYRPIKNKSYEDVVAAISYGYYLSFHNLGPQYRPVFQALADRTKSCMVIDDFTSVKNIGTGTNSSSDSNSQRTIDTFFSASSDRNPKIKRSKAVIEESLSDEGRKLLMGERDPLPEDMNDEEASRLIFRKSAPKICLIVDKESDLALKLCTTICWKDANKEFNQKNMSLWGVLERIGHSDVDYTVDAIEANNNEVMYGLVKVFFYNRKEDVPKDIQWHDTPEDRLVELKEVARKKGNKNRKTNSKADGYVVYLANDNKTGPSGKALTAFRNWGNREGGVMAAYSIGGFGQMKVEKKNAKAPGPEGMLFKNVFWISPCSEEERKKAKENEDVNAIKRIVEKNLTTGTNKHDLKPAVWVPSRT